MTTQLEQAARQALEALDDRASLMKWQAAREALRAALEQPAQDEPVATIFEGFVAKWNLPATFTGVLYTRPQAREWVGLTDEEIDQVTYVQWSSDPIYAAYRAYARAIEAKLKEKNA